ncbi:serine hydrolase domain-containing protein [Shewanella sp.]|uniref:serine hydrolase domain-containing protein n=1 Tax=Shewanella sp. TaxID=50422 RepID=UPI003A9807B0
MQTPAPPFARPRRHLLHKLLLPLLLSSCSWLSVAATPVTKPVAMPTTNTINAAEAQRLDQLLQSYIDSNKLANVVTLVVKDGQIVYQKGFGWKDVPKQTPVAVDDYYVLFSQTKAIVSVAFMTLVERGLVDINDPVSQYFPEIPQQVITEVAADGSYKTRPVKTPMTFVHLLSHTAGFNAGQVPKLRWGDAEQTDLPTLVWDGQPVTMYPSGQRSHSDNYQRRYLKDEMEELARWPLGFDPGSEWHYHTSTNMLAYMIERISGQTLQQYVTEQVLKPLGMNDTAWFYAPEKLSRFVNAYSSIDGNIIAEPNLYRRGAVNPEHTYAEGAIGLNGPIGDYAKFLQMMLNQGELNGVRILKPETVKLMTTINRLPSDEADPDDKFRFGLGFEIFQKQAPAEAVSNTAYGWGGMMGTGYLVDPQNQLVVLYYINQYQREDLYPQVVEQVYKLFEPAK